MSLLVAAAFLLQAPTDGAPDYNRDVRPILTGKCLACHGADPKHREGGLRLDDRNSATTKLVSEAVAIVPGKLDKSEVIRRIRADDDERMPPAGKGERLTAKEIAILERWIASGAEYAPHWSFVPLKPVQPPVVAPQYQAWVRNPIDAFTVKAMTAHGLEPSSTAEPGQLLRRASFDLVGLPPTPRQLNDFLNDDSNEAYERAVHRMLADPGYGERWARVWLDLARYADSAGYGSDPLRTIWRYRDWVIDAKNHNLPFDEFTRLQLAGDLRPNPTPEELIATAFHRNTMTNTEGGTDDEEFRVAAVKDRTDVTMQVWMGLTAGCAKCHSHKFDPLTQKEYYQLFAFFNQTADNDQPSEAPTIPAPTAGQRRENERIDAEVARLRKKLGESSLEIAAAQRTWEQSFAPAANSAWRPASARLSVEKNLIRIMASAPPGATAVRFDLPQKGLTLSHFKVEGAKGDLADKPATGRTVRIDLPGNQRIIHLAEVEVYSNGVNIARQGVAKQSSTYGPAEAKRAIDGNRDGVFDKGSTSHTESQNDPWWEVDLGKDVPIERIGVWNRTDAGLADRLKGWTISLLDKDRKVVWKQTPAAVPQPSQEIAVSQWKELPIAGLRIDGGPLQRNQDKLSIDLRRRVTMELAAALSADQTALRMTASLPDQTAPRKEDAMSLGGSISAAMLVDASIPKRANLPPTVATALEQPSAKRSADQQQMLATYFREKIAGKATQDAIAKLEASRPKPTTVPVMSELPKDKRRSSHVLVKGNFLQPGETVTANVPAAFHVWPRAATKDRAGLAEWLLSRDNPLTARVAVNRLWARLFGRGLVETEEDFGVQGEHPSHPELLDWLANEYVRSGWDSKAMLRLIVTSATYRQTTKVTPAALERDPANRWLSRFPRLRLEAEMVRDQALATSGKLVRKVGGPSVYPPQPDGLWQAAFNGERTWPTSANSDRFRRGLYVFWRRTVPYPSMAAFDAPSRETCTLRRKSTNTPIQAFVTLNDPVYVELARALAVRIVEEGGASMDDRVRYGLRLCLCREPTHEQVKTLSTLVATSAKGFNDADAKRWGGDPPNGVTPSQFAAWVLAANALMNLDGFLTKG